MIRFSLYIVQALKLNMSRRIFDRTQKFAVAMEKPFQGLPRQRRGVK